MSSLHPTAIRSLLCKLAAGVPAVVTRRKKVQRGWYTDKSPGWHDLKGKFEEVASRSEIPVKRAFADAPPAYYANTLATAPHALRQRFDGFARILDEKGVNAGTFHHRINIPKTRVSEADLGTLGFEPVNIAIPEAGQQRFQTFRHPDNLYHLHDHGERWTMHRDEHPSSTMLARKIGPVKAFVQGLPHVVTEGLPGLGAYVAGQLRGRQSTADRIDAETPETTKAELAKVAAEVLERFGFHAVKAAAEAAPDPLQGLVDVFQKHDFGFDAAGRSKVLRKTHEGASGANSEIMPTTNVGFGELV